MRDIIVVGGGASGMMAAICCARAGKEVTILEHNEKPGRKLLATGNGKCNFTNLIQSEKCYCGEEPSFGWNQIQDFNEERCLSFFRGLGIYPYIKNNYCYPYSEQAITILDGLQRELLRLKVKIKSKEHVKKINQRLNGYEVHTETYTYECRKVILACGGKSGNISGADGSGYELVKQLGHTLTPLFPALVGLKAKEGYFKGLSGIRAKAKLELWIGDQMKAWEQGELQLTSYGISGIPVFQVSRFAARALLEGKEIKGVLKLLPDVEESKLVSFFKEQQRENGYKSVLEAVSAFMDCRLAEIMIHNSKITKKELLNQIPFEKIEVLVRELKNWTVHITDTNGYEHAQVTGGGVRTNELYEKTLESKLAKGAYIIGELVDVDGTCGGYNLQWAWTSGYIAGTAAAAE